MLKDKNLLIVGGTGRNVGKTEFVCRLIKKIAANITIYALKVSAIFPDEDIYHGSHSPKESDQFLFEETRKSTGKDTSRMLDAGAARVFYLRCEDSATLAAYRVFRKKLPEDAVIICESNSLGEYVHPGLQIMVRNQTGTIKPRALPRLQLADIVVVSDGKSGFAELQKINFNQQQSWHIIS